MRTTRLFSVTLVAVALLAGCACAAGESSIAGAAAFMAEPNGARPVGLGGAFVAVADDVNALYYNPGALGRIEGVAFQASYASMSMDRTPYHGALVWNMPSVGALGFAMTGFKISDIDGRDTSGEPTASFESTETALTIGYGRQVAPWLGAGASFKYLEHSLSESKADGIGFDVGVHSRFEIGSSLVDALSFGVAVSNMGSKLEWDTSSSRSDDVLATSRYGVAVDVTPGEVARIVATAEGSKTGDRDMEMHVGAEFWVRDVFAVRAGLDDGDLVFGLSGGVGPVRLDYAYAPDPLDEGETHWVSLHVQM